MGSWWGVGVANAVNSGMSTYSKLKTIQDENIEREEKEKAKKISAETVGQVGQMRPDGTYAGGTVNSAVGAGEGLSGGLDATEFTPNKSAYTEQQAYRDQATKLAGAGLHDRAAKSRQTGLGIEAAELGLDEAKDKQGERKRTKDIQARVDAAFKNHSTAALSNPDSSERYVVEGYGKIPDGHSAVGQTIAGPDGKPQRVINFVDDKTGKTVNQIPLTRENAYRAMRSALMQELASISPEWAEKSDAHFDKEFDRRMKGNQDARDGQRLGLQTEQVGLETRRVRIAEDDAPFHRRQMTASANASNASAYASSINASINKMGLDAMKENRVAMQAFNALPPEQQRGAEGREIVERAAVNYALASNDPEKILRLFVPSTKGADLVKFKDYVPVMTKYAQAKLDLGSSKAEGYTQRMNELNNIFRPMLPPGMVPEDPYLAGKGDPFAAAPPRTQPAERVGLPRAPGLAQIKDQQNPWVRPEPMDEEERRRREFGSF